MLSSSSSALSWIKNWFPRQKAEPEAGCPCNRAGPPLKYYSPAAGRVWHCTQRFGPTVCESACAADRSRLLAAGSRSKEVETTPLDVGEVPQKESRARREHQPLTVHWACKGDLREGGKGRRELGNDPRERKKIMGRLSHWKQKENV